MIYFIRKGYRTRAYDVRVVRMKNELRTKRLTAYINHLAATVLRYVDYL